MNVYERLPIRLISLFNRFIVILMGISAFGAGLISVILAVKAGPGDTRWMYIATLPMLFAGILLIIGSKWRPSMIILLAGLGHSGSIIWSEALALERQLTPIPILMTIAGLAMLISSIHCALGYRYSGRRIFFILLVEFILFCPAVFILVAAFREELFSNQDALLLLFQGVFVLAFMVYLLRPTVRDDSTDRRLILGMRVVESFMTSSSSVQVHESETDGIVGKDLSGWTEGFGPVISTHTSTAVGGGRRFNIISERWEDEDAIRVTIRQEARFQPTAVSFLLKGYTFEDLDDRRYLRIYGEGGYYVRLLLAVSEEKNDDPMGLPPDDAEEMLMDAVNEVDPV